MPEEPPPERKIKLDYVSASKLSVGVFHTAVWAMIGLFGGYFFSVIAGFILVGGPQGPLIFLIILWPTLIVGCILCGRHFDRKRGRLVERCSRLPDKVPIANSVEENER